LNDLLVSSPNGLYFIRDGNARKLSDCSCYGVTWDRERLYVGEKENLCVRAWGPDLSRGEVVINDVHDPHQALWTGGALYATNTGMNTLDVDRDGCVERRSWGQDNDLHLNSVWIYGDLLWVVEHRNGRPPSRVRAFGPRFRDLVRHNFYDFNEGEQAWGLHNVYVEGGKLYTLAVGEMFVRDLGTGRTDSIRLGGYLRGLARTKDRWYVGRSRLTERQRRREGMGEVLALDDEFRLLGTARLGDAGQVYEVRALDGDKAHNRLSCPWRER